MAVVVTTPEALEELDHLPSEIVARVARLLERLERWPQTSGAKPLSGRLAGRWRLRTGDYRLQFRVEQRDRHRGEDRTSRQVLRELSRDRKYPNHDARRAAIRHPPRSTITANWSGKPGSRPCPARTPRATIPAVESARVLLARKLIRRRRAGWTYAKPNWPAGRPAGGNPQPIGTRQAQSQCGDGR